MRRLLLLSLVAIALQAQKQPRLFLISLDGMGFQAFQEDPAASELKTMRKLASEGIYAPMQAAFPSLTAPGHASIFTGAYGNVNGVTANRIPAEFGKHVNGFRAEQLKAETFWVKAGRGGIKSVAHNPTQGFPCNAFNSGVNVTLFNGYQTTEVAPERLLRAADVQWLDGPPAGYAQPPKSRMPARYFRYDAGRIQFVGVLFAKGLRYDTIRMTAHGGRRYVDAVLKEAETEPVRVNGNPPRPLARYFSEALPIADLTAVHFRLFEVSADGSEFLLYQTEANEISICVDGTAQAEAFKRRLLNSTGAFVGNGAGEFYSHGQLGKIHTDGLAERRWLETLELHARQTMRHTRAMLSEYSPTLLVDYISTPDDMLHSWWGLLKDAANEPYRRWGYQIIDWRVEQLRQQLNLDRDHLLIVSDHGMTAVDHEVRLNVLLKEFGFEGKVWAGAQFLRLKDRSDTELLRQVREKLSTVTDGGTKVFSEWFEPAEYASRFGIGGEFGGDLYFDLAPGYSISFENAQPAIVKLPAPKGVHGLLPTRSDLQALFIAAGPDLSSRSIRMRTIDVAPLVLRLLGL